MAVEGGREGKGHDNKVEDISKELSGS